MFEIIGQIVVGLFLLALAILALEIVRDIYRAFRVTNIRVRIYYGKGWRSFRKVGARKYFRQIWQEIFSSYTYAQSGGLRIYRDGRITRERYLYG